MIGTSKHGFISRGFLEVFVDGVWGGVCSDKWTETESYVACGNLGYPDIEVGEIFILFVTLVFHCFSKFIYSHDIFFF